MKKIVWAIAFLLLGQAIAINYSPVAEFNYEINGKLVTFDASSSYDLDGYIVNYTWDFGDGSIGYGIIAVHEYENEGRYNVTLTIYDNSWNMNSTKETIVIDITPPITNYKLNNINGRNGWCVSSVVLTLNATDNLSGVNKTYYRLNGGWSEYNSPLMIFAEGEHTIYYCSMDNSKNIEETKSVVIKIDKTAPSTYAVIDKNSSNGWYNEKINISLYSNDSLSGVEKTYYRVNGGEFLEYSGVLSLGDGKYLFEFFSIDFAGNFEENKKIQIKIDTIPPEITLSPSKGFYIFGRKIFDTERPFIIGNITVDVEGYDLNGIKLLEFYYDGLFKGNSTSSFASWEINEFSIGKHEIKVVAYDFAGNKKIKSEEVYIINLKWT